MKLAGRTRVLLLRCCRMPVFERALAGVRARYPGAEVTALTQPEWERAVQAAGVDRTLLWQGRFATWRLWRPQASDLRRTRFDVVAIPYMGADDWGYDNVQRLACRIAASRFLPLPQGRADAELSRAEFRRRALLNTIRRLTVGADVPLLLLMLIAAAAIPKRARRRRGVGKLRVLHIIPSLGTGGAQVQLAQVAAHTPQEQFEVEVLAFSREGGDFALSRLPPHVRVAYLETWPGLFTSFLEVRRYCIRGRFDVVQTWMFHANVIGAAAARLSGRRRLITSIRSTSIGHYTWFCKRWYRLADILSSHAADIVTVNAGRTVADQARWAVCSPRRIRLVPNGLDPALLLRESPGAHRWLRESLGLPPTAVVVGSVGRLAIEKDHETFLRALAGLRRMGFAFHAVLVGAGEMRRRLEDLAAELGIRERLELLGDNVSSRRVIAGLDLFVLSSRIEGFPNALLEAVILGIPAVATNVGACSDILAETDLAPAGDADWLGRRAAAALQRPAEAWRHAQDLQERALRCFTIDGAVARWTELYLAVCNAPAPAKERPAPTPQQTVREART